MTDRERYQQYIQESQEWLNSKIHHLEDLREINASIKMSAKKGGRPKKRDIENAYKMNEYVTENDITYCEMWGIDAIREAQKDIYFFKRYRGG